MYICIYLYTDIYNSFTEKILIFIFYLVHVMLWLDGNLLYIFDSSGAACKRLKKLTSFKNTTFNKTIQKALASWMFRILSPFDFQKGECAKCVEY